MIAYISVKGRCGDISCTAGNDQTLRGSSKRTRQPLTEVVQSVLGEKHGGLEASRETPRARREVKCRGLLDWSFAGEFLAWLALSERDVFKCENHFGEFMTRQDEHVHCSATVPRKNNETGCVVEQRPTDGLKCLQEPNS